MKTAIITLTAVTILVAACSNATVTLKGSIASNRPPAALEVWLARALGPGF